MLLEDLRQICILKKLNEIEKWWSYIRAVNGCSYNDKACFKDKTSSAGIKPAIVDECVEASFTNPSNKLESDNIYFQEERFTWTLFSNHISPSLTIDDYQYRVGYLVTIRATLMPMMYLWRSAQATMIHLPNVKTTQQQPQRATLGK